MDDEMNPYGHSPIGEVASIPEDELQFLVANCNMTHAKWVGKVLDVSKYVATG